MTRTLCSSLAAIALKKKNPFHCCWAATSSTHRCLFLQSYCGLWPQMLMHKVPLKASTSVEDCHQQTVPQSKVNLKQYDFFFNTAVSFQTQLLLPFCHIWVHWQAWKRHAVLSHLQAVKCSSQSRSQSRAHRQGGDYSTADPQERYHLHIIIQLSANTVTGDTMP